MKILHVCAGWDETNGAAVIGRLLASEHQSQGHEVRFGSWVSFRAIRAADEVWTHCGWLPCLWWAGLFARRLIRVPEACYDPLRLAYHGWKKTLVRPIERFFLRRASRVLATCEAERDWVLRYEPKAKVEVTDIRRFFDLTPAATSPAARGPRKLRLLFLGRHHPLKGLDCLERAIEGLEVELRVESQLHGEEKEAAWRWCDCLVLPTLTENFGLVVAETLAHGRRVITTDGAPVWRDQPGVVYLKGYREAENVQRVELLRAAIQNEIRNGEYSHG